MPDLCDTNRIATKPVNVRVDQLDIRYQIYEERSFSAREMVGRNFRSRRSIEVHAIKQVSFEVRSGEALGIVGSNGSGKSTLLRAIAGLQSRSGGTVRVRGEAHLLGVGAALKPTLSGYRNIFLGGLAMGIARSEIDGQVERIREFSGLGDSLARPMNTYSSGMRARLAFSIATLRVPTVLLIDEALAVGDQDFRSRSLERINEIREQASTVIMVTHNVSEIRATCTRALWLDNGRLRLDSSVDEVLGAYSDSAS